MRDPVQVIGFAIRFAAEEWATTPMHAHPVAPSFTARHVLAALRDEYGTWRIPSGYLRTDGSEVDGTDVVVPVPAAAEEAGYRWRYPRLYVGNLTGSVVDIHNVVSGEPVYVLRGVTHAQALAALAAADQEEKP